MACQYFAAKGPNNCLIRPDKCKLWFKSIVESFGKLQQSQSLLLLTCIYTKVLSQEFSSLGEKWKLKGLSKYVIQEIWYKIILWTRFCCFAGQQPWDFRKLSQSWYIFTSLCFLFKNTRSVQSLFKQNLQRDQGSVLLYHFLWKTKDKNNSFIKAFFYFPIS